jgi:hypothetical protein
MRSRFAAFTLCSIQELREVAIRALWKTVGNQRRDGIGGISDLILRRGSRWKQGRLKIAETSWAAASAF